MSVDEFGIEGEDEDFDSVEFGAEEDIETYKQRRRLKAILDAQERVGTVHDKVFAHVLEGQLDRATATAYYRRVVQHYITLVEPLIHAYEVGEQYWLKARIGTITIEPPDEFHDLAEDEHVVIDGPEPTAQTHDVVGLKRVVELPEVISCEFTIRVAYEHHGSKKLRETVETPIPEDILLNAYRATNQFLREIDLDLNLENDSLPTESGFDATAPSPNQ